MADDFVSVLLYERVVEDENRRSLGRQRVFRDRKNAFELPPDKFIMLFRLSKELAMKLCDLLRSELQVQTVRRTALTVETKVLIALRFFATGSYQNSVAQDITVAVTQKTVSCCLASVTKAINKVMFNEYIAFSHDRQRLMEVKRGFMQRYQFPGVVGAIDCTLIAIVAPPRDHYPQELYLGRKGYHCLNVQMVCDSMMRILNVNAKFPGSSHDAYIWKNSSLRKSFEQKYLQGERDSWLLGDNGYPNEPWLLTPILQAPENSPGSRYNVAHAKARNCIERCFGVLKQRFRCLLRHRTLHYNPTTSGLIINSCAVLHNMCITHRIPLPANEEHVEQEVDEPSASHHVNEPQESYRSLGQLQRQRLLQMRFTVL